ncbi:MAG: cysteine protease [Ignavibacteriales bacterium UTCHB2]|nr:MAG: Transglutaminase-like superfamily protein [Ignavibacteria bacterium ADurb.Bin266]OQY70762.1 MAG: cysteine protease [Ignavibacteriales bacterium UTCHB2]HQI40579.1 transglutaminase-like domain-containing protein [Ignavibacteriaceae bacterium]HQJ46260.1 transglutaminase-like domain-containing protein [Ignavibacteriaceae bacterium]
MKIYFWIFLLTSMIAAQTKFNDVNELVNSGEYTKAAELIENKIKSTTITSEDKLDLLFEKERLDRIKIDFNKTADDVLKFINKYYPDVKEKDLAKWENDGSLEYKIIDGKKWYFSRSAPNLFRINKEAKEQKLKIDGFKKDPKDVFLEEHIPLILDESANGNEDLVRPVTFKLDYTVTVDANDVPDGEIIRCWLPFPREGHRRQVDVKLLSVNSDEYVLASNDNQQRTVYIQKPAIKDQPTIFNMVLEVTGYNEINFIQPNQIKPYNKESGLYKTYIAERAPHIIFSDKIKELSNKIVGDEANPYLIAKKIFTWISTNIPWAGAREYSTLENIPEYCMNTGHGDCGIKTLLFMTLCRYNGIPAKWQSGWMLHPGEINLHDWSEIYLEGYGWVPVDQSFGLVDSDKEDERYFFLGNIDAYHLIVNDDYSRPLFPAKIFPRSETVDFQRGELEWRGGNIYFNQWDYNMKVEYK